MKIGISCYPTQGGSGVVATELGQALARMGHEVHFITSSMPIRLRHFDKNIYFHEVQPESYPVFIHPPYSLSLAAKMAEVSEAYDLDILHAHYAVPHAACAYLATQMLQDHRTVKTVTTLHGTDITLVGQAPSFYRVTKFSIEQSACVTAVSNWLLEETRRIFKLDRPIDVIPNFVDTSVFAPSKNQEARRAFVSPDEKLLLHISNFRPVKNLGVVMDVFNRVQKESPAKLLLVGDGPERIPVERQAYKLGLQDKVLFLGGQDHIEELIPLADAFLLPSKHESFGLVALEAMACGVPVVASNVGGTREVVEEGVSGYLCHPDDAAGLAAATLKILSDSHLAQHMGEAGRQRALDHYQVEDILPRYLAIYQQCGV